MLLLHWAFHQSPFNIATRNTWWIGVERNPRAIIGIVGVLKSFGSGVCTTGISSHFVVCESLKNVSPFLTQELFILVFGHTDTINLQRGHRKFFLACCFCSHASGCCSSLSMFAYCVQMAKLTYGIEATQTKTIHFLKGENLG